VLAGIFSECGSAEVKSLKIVRHGDFSSSWSKVDFIIQGSCLLKESYRLNPTEYIYSQKKKERFFHRKGYDYREPNIPDFIEPEDLTGTVPFLNKHFFSEFKADGFGGWEIEKAEGDHFIRFLNREDRKTALYDKSSLKKLYYQRNKGTIAQKKHKKEARKIANKKSLIRDEKYRKRQVLLEKWKRYKTLSPKERKEVMREMNKPISSRYKSADTQAPIPTKHKKNTNADNHQLVADVNSFFRKNPKIARLFNSLDRDKQIQLADRIAKGKNKQTRYRVFLQIGKELQTISSGHNRIGFTRHSHAGRLHSHALPRQGKAHRHGNGAMGR